MNNFRKYYFFEHCIFYIAKDYNHFLVLKKFFFIRDIFIVLCICFIRIFFLFFEIMFKIFKLFYLILNKLIYLKLNKIKRLKLNFLKDLYNIFSSKILISSTAFFILYLIIFMCCLNFNIHFLDPFYVFYFFNFPILEYDEQYLLNFPFLEYDKQYLSNFPVLEEDKEYVLNVNKINVKNIYEDETNSDPRVKPSKDINTLLYLEVVRSLRELHLYNYIYSESCKPILYTSNLSDFIDNYVDFISHFSFMKPRYSSFYQDFFIEKKYVYRREVFEVFFYDLFTINIWRDIYNLISFEKSFEKNSVEKLYVLEILEIFDIPEGLNILESLDLSTELKPFFNLNLVLEIYIFSLILIFINVFHILIAFLSLLYDYLLKKLNKTNVFVLFLIFSTTIQLFFKIILSLLI